MPTEHSGFVTERVTELKDLRLTLHQLRHKATGARFVHLANDDQENVFGVGFRTTPLNSSGVAHILEHTTLCGSRRYPVRDIFFSMLNRSLNTFMNALTASDWTFYPFATQNRKDFHNLMEVYLDAAFFPLLRRTDFHQEGIRFELDGGKTLLPKGVVYNEMKGALSNPATLAYYRLTEALYPTTTYGWNSGGEPGAILDLTWEELRQFHDTYYHPSNALFYSYGSFPLGETLELVHERVLRHFGAQTVQSAVPLEQRFSSPRHVEKSFALEADQPLERRALLLMGWLTNPIEDQLEGLGLSLLSELLLGDAAAPLRKALIDSRLGEGICPGSGYHDENRETFFAAGLEGTDPGQAGELEKLILETLEKTAAAGFERERVESAIHQLELAHREIGGGEPYGLQLLMRLVGTWMHCDDPLASLCFDEHIETIRREMENGFFESLIRKHLLDNPHRVSLLLKPDPKEEERQNTATATVMREKLAALSPEECQQLVAEAQELRDFQEGADDVSCLPSLCLEDIPAEENATPWKSMTHNGAPLFGFELSTNGIGYFGSWLDLANVPEHVRAYVPVFSFLLTRVGAGGDDYLTMARRIAAATGGVSAVPLVLGAPSGLRDHRLLLSVSGKALMRNQKEMFQILRDLLYAPDFRDRKRLATLLDQLKVSLVNSVADSGHRYAMRLAAASLSEADQRREEWSGIGFIRQVCALAGSDDSGWADFEARLEELKIFLAENGSIQYSVLASPGDLPMLLDSLSILTKDHAGCGNGARCLSGAAPSAPRATGVAIPAAVSYVARVWPAVTLEHEDCAGLLVLAKLLRSRFLHREIREKGGAYGGLASFDPGTGVFAMASYRDPRLAGTLRDYRRAAEWAASGDFEERDVEESILGAFSDLDRPLPPEGRSNREVLRHLAGISPKMRKDFRAGMLAVTRNALCDLATRYLVKQWEQSAVGVLSSREMLLHANEELEGEVLTINEL